MMAIEDASTSVVNPASTEIDQVLDVTLRPKLLSDFIGQEQLKKSLGVFLQAARDRGEALEHVLLAGPPGLWPRLLQTAGGGPAARQAACPRHPRLRLAPQ